MLISKEAEVRWHHTNKNHYINRGYNFTKFNDKFMVNVDDLTNGSSATVEVLCDYCKITKIQKPYERYIKQNEKTLIHKDCCGNPKCQNEKRQESMFSKYGEKSALKLDIFKNKMIETNNERYGVSNVLLVKEIKDKALATLSNNYGVQNPSDSKIIQEKRLNTFNERFGCDNPSQSNDIKLKKIETLQRNYGVDNPSQSPEIQAKIRESFYKNGTTPTSNQQLYVNTIYKGILNYPYFNASLDIAFPENKLYVECDFGGHDLSVKMGVLTQEEFDKKARNRWYSLNRSGWKEIRIISVKDKIPSNLILFYMLQYAKKYISTGHSWIKFDIDNSKVITSQYEKQFNFGKLRNITKKDVEHI